LTVDVESPLGKRSDRGFLPTPPPPPFFSLFSPCCSFRVTGLPFSPTLEGPMVLFFLREFGWRSGSAPSFFFFQYLVDAYLSDFSPLSHNFPFLKLVPDFFDRFQSLHYKFLISLSLFPAAPLLRPTPCAVYFCEKSLFL